MSGQGSEDPNHFGRRSVTSDRTDPFESMREQMEKERENFFKGVNPRDWPNENNTARGGLFNRPPRTSFGGFPSGPGMRAPRYVNDFPEELDGFGLVPGSGHSLPRHRKSSSGSGQNVEDDVSDHSSNCSGNSNHSGETEAGVPINVVHEKTLPKHKYGQAVRNTTELPAKATGNESPRLERAHSEPPNKFKQRLNLANPLYSTIPENSESSGQTNRPMPHLDSRNPIKTSASAPSVPSSSHQTQESHPVPPPRRSPPRNNMSNPIPPAQPTNSAANVRHIPIFVEGRPEPIFNTTVNVGQQDPGQQAAQDLSFPKPSEFYPPGVQRIKSRDDTMTPETPNFQNEGPFTLNRGQKQIIPTQEPTTPIGPPPGPIPMGYMPAPAEQVKEPTTPLGPPPGPIPMGYLPSQMKEDEASPVPPPSTNGPSAPESQPPPPPQRNRTPPQQIPLKEQNGQTDPQEKKCENIPKPEAPRKTSAEKATAGDATLRKPSNTENKAAKEPVVNFIPIKVEHSRPESPMPKANSRAPSQEPQLRPGKSPTPARNTPQPEQQQAPKDPKIAKLDKIKEEVDILMEKIENFKGKKKDKEYLYLDEMLTRHLIALDGIEPEGQSEIRQMRKESIKSVNRCLSLLDHKVTEGNAEENNKILSELAAKTEDLAIGNGDSSSQKS
eukprot:TRINITY_DN10444_c0_g1_i1.p1 TRINITY_DN10444_c0_g1~~TRINITY_DN10444_c0_g1_i1.p1  ORF type:complete len:668 (-),score=164.87 TRINITY_DN10444_c0_g1_i1:987-2990(-)